MATMAQCRAVNVEECESFEFTPPIGSTDLRKFTNAYRDCSDWYSLEMIVTRVRRGNDEERIRGAYVGIGSEDYNIDRPLRSY